MGTRNQNISRFEITGVYTHPDACVDVVLVHGLNGDPQKTWTATNRVFWPADLLPESLEDHHANILVYGYNADVYARGRESSASDNFIFQHAQTLVSHLTTYRKSERTTKNPIIWVAHSLGGILVKRALLYSNDISATNHEPFRAIYVSTYGVIFLGTPHTGSGFATWAQILQTMSDVIVPKKLFESESVLLKTLKNDNERLQEINNHFLDIYQRFQIHMAHENHKTDLKGTKAFVVTADSASPQLPGVVYYGIEASHSNMCKFASKNAPGYRTVSYAIYEWIEKAPPVIERRWEVEEEDCRARARRDLDERNLPYIGLSQPGDAPSYDKDEIVAAPTRPSLTSTATDNYASSHSRLPSDTSTNTIVGPHPESAMDLDTEVENPGNSDSFGGRFEPLFLHPEPFRPNSYFIGRESELQDLHKKLTDSKKRAEGTSAVLIQSLPGGGKTHIARQYVFGHRSDYPGGIFWVRSKSVAEMEQFYWKIAKSQALRELAHKATDSAAGSANGHDRHDVVAIVRRWISSLSHWLMVFDGIHFDTPGIRRFIPDAKNSSIIYTSTQNTGVGMYAFDNPQIMELGLLSLRDAQFLLLDEMEKRRPWTQDDLSRAKDLVQLMGRLPLMIHVAAQHLKATREPLSKYLRNYQVRPRLGQLSAFRAVWSELQRRGATAALNLMYILAFYDQIVPVGFVILGLDALTKATPVKTRDTKSKVQSLNNTLKVLIAFALIERTESDNLTPSNSQGSSQRSSRHRFDKSSESIDVLRIHSVVQAFFVDLLQSDTKDHLFWLERSARVFCTSFDKAERKIPEITNLGMADDYHRFTIHGRKLLEHLGRAEKKANGPANLVLLRKDIEAKLSSCKEAINHLSKSVQNYPVEDNVSVSLTSVFERANSSSESDSASQSSQLSIDGTGGASHMYASLGGLDGHDDRDMGPIVNPNGSIDGYGMGKGKEPVTGPWFTQSSKGEIAPMSICDSPTTTEFPKTSGDHNPYHWHTTYYLSPYPAQGSTIPAPPLPDDDNDDETETATPRVDTSSGPSAAFSPPGARYHYGPPTNDWRLLASSHRSVRKNESRRYHDRAGSWRDSTISDPRISVSREMAKGNMSMPQDEHAGSELSGGVGRSDSRAELRLSQIRAVAPPVSSRTPDYDAIEDWDDDTSYPVQKKGRAQSTGSLGLRPRPVEIASKPQEVQMQDAPDETNPPSSFFKILSQSPTSAWTSAALRRIKDNILPSRSSSSSSNDTQKKPLGGNVAVSPYLNTPGPPTSSIDSLLNKAPTPIFKSSRSARSSPSQNCGPFVPPPVAPLSDGSGRLRVGAASYRRDLPTSIRQWDTQIYRPGRTYLDSVDLSYGMATDDLAASFPPLPRTGRLFPAANRPQASSASPYQQSLLHPSSPADGYTSQPMSRGPSAQSQPSTGGTGITMHVTRAGHLFSSVYEGDIRSHSLPSNQFSRPISVPHKRSCSPDSFVETEPSPRTTDVFSDVNTSYRRREERQAQQFGRQRAGSGARTTPPLHPYSKDRLGTLGGVPMTRPGPSSSRGSASGSGTGTGASSIYPSTVPIDVDGDIYTSEPMARSGSGGIRLSDGRVVPFGQSPRVAPVINALDHDGSIPDAMIGLGIVQQE